MRPASRSPFSISAHLVETSPSTTRLSSGRLASGSNEPGADPEQLGRGDPALVVLRPDALVGIRLRELRRVDLDVLAPRLGKIAHPAADGVRRLGRQLEWIGIR